MKMVKLRPVKQLIKEGWRVQTSGDGSMLFLHWPGSTGSFVAVSAELQATPHQVTYDPQIAGEIVAAIPEAFVEVTEET